MRVEHPERESSSKLIWKLNQKMVQHSHRFVYRYATRRLNTEGVDFLNYGYEEDPPMSVTLSAADEPNRFFIQLYHRVATQGQLAGRRVLEVGCGHGGGASYIMRTLHPDSYVGLDVNPAGIAYCQKRHDLAGLEFVQGDAEDLPFPERSFDAVINVESSHLYPRFSLFLDEVARVLRPGGQFLYADGRTSFAVASWESALENAPMRMVSQRTINPEVVRGMEKNPQQLQDLIDRITPAPLRKIVHGYAPATRACDDLRSGGATEYRMYSFVK